MKIKLIVRKKHKSLIKKKIFKFYYQKLFKKNILVICT